MDTTERVILCNGKIYYDLTRERTRRGRNDVAIVRIEQLYPLGHDELFKALASYEDGTKVVWVQEEPENMGALGYFVLRLKDVLSKRFRVHTVSRPPSASPATGSTASHRFEQKAIYAAAFGRFE